MRHGTTKMYREGCRCQLCRDAAAAHARDYQARRRAAGAPLKVDPAEAVAHIRRLHDAGYSYRAIGEQCGLAKEYVQSLHKRKRIMRTTEDRILAVPMKIVPASGLVSSAKAKLLVDEISKAGISQRDVSRMLGNCPEGTLNFLRRPRMWATTLHKIILVYRLLAARGLVPASALEDVT